MAVDTQVIATLTGAIIVSRGATTIAEIQEAWKDATYVVAPKPKTQDYETWQAANDAKPTVPRPDFRTEAQREQARIKRRMKMAGSGERTQANTA
jgi:hypothetical protein